MINLLGKLIHIKLYYYGKLIYDKFVFLILIVYVWQLIGCASGLADFLVNNYVSDVVFQLTSKLPTNSLKAQCFNRITRESGKLIKFTAHIVIPLIP